MKKLIELLQENCKVNHWLVSIRQNESYQMFFVKGRLETVRCTDTCDKEITVYADHDGFKGSSSFFCYPYTSQEQLARLIDDAADKALLIQNQNYHLPAAETGEYTVQSNFPDYAPADLAARIAKAVFDANDVGNAALNSVEIFINKRTETVANSNGLHKTQHRYDAMVEAIPTYNGTAQSVELYEQYNFGIFDEELLRKEISEKLMQVKARYDAVKPDFVMDCPCVLNRQELSGLFARITRSLNYSAVYSHSNLYSKGDAIQTDPQGDLIGITMTGEIPGSIRSAKFDSDGMALRPVRLVENGKVLNYFGANRFGQYIGETPTGSLNCCIVDLGSISEAPDTYLEIVSMSGLQVDLHSDYIGGEVRLAYYHKGDTVMPVTGISVSGKLSAVLNGIQLSNRSVVYGGYQGPDMAVLKGMKIF